MLKNNLECVTKFFKVNPHDLVMPDKCTLPQVRNAINMNDNIRQNHNSMIMIEGVIIIATIITSGIVFTRIEPGIVRIINAVKSKDKEVKEDHNNKEEE